MVNARQRNKKLSDRIPKDWRRRITSYRGVAAAHFRRVMKTLSKYDWMTSEERERAAFVIVEKEQLRERAFEIDD